MKFLFELFMLYAFWSIHAEGYSRLLKPQARVLPCQKWAPPPPHPPKYMPL